MYTQWVSLCKPYVVTYQCPYMESTQSRKWVKIFDYWQNEYTTPMLNYAHTVSTAYQSMSQSCSTSSKVSSLDSTLLVKGGPEARQFKTASLEKVY